MKLTLTTREARPLLRQASRGSGDPPTLETYISPGREIEIFCSTNEREEFQEAEDITLDTDSPDARSFALLALYLTVNFRLQVQNVDLSEGGAK